MSFPSNIVVRPGSAVRLPDLSPRDTLHFSTKEATKADIIEKAARISEMQDTLYAEGKRSLLIVLQGMDTSGKDGTIRDVFNATGPLGVHVTAFRPPNEEELSHDYLWRVHRACPRRGT